MVEQPTLKVRFALHGASSSAGRDCRHVARSLLIGDDGFTVLDSKWGRQPAKWRADGGGWGRVRLDERQRGYIEGVRASSSTDAHEGLLAIIDSLIGEATDV